LDEDLLRILSVTLCYFQIDFLVLLWYVLLVSFCRHNFASTFSRNVSVSRNILLVEPGYKTKFPPLGLMKISAYHKALGDKVYFVKGMSKRSPVIDTYWDRVYVTTLFTYNWNITIDTINKFKLLVGGDLGKLRVGGIMASLMAKEVWQETGVVPHTGVLSSPGALDEGNDLIVDAMTPDYELFKGSGQEYTLVPDSYFGYSTRGCVNKCDFCGVRKLEPKFIEYSGLKPYVQAIADQYGEKQHLVLFDNNVLASQKFKQIIRDIKDLGFEAGAKFEKKPGVKAMRKVDFNQGTDARLMTEEKVKLLSEIAIHPLRIAFDSIKFKDLYCEKVRLAAKYGIRNLSNYILYNHKDTPEDFWQRLKINIDLNNELDLKIYSFPMKFIPLNAKDRAYTDEPNWNWYFVRGVQRILNVLKGSVMTSEDFFFRAFGANEAEFFEILHMPENILMQRTREEQPIEREWKKAFHTLTENERKELLAILCIGKTKIKLFEGCGTTRNNKIKKILEYYLPERQPLPLLEAMEGARA
jgi:hypothetical protein